MSIMAQMKEYPYTTYSSERNEYGELTVSTTTNAYGEVVVEQTRGEVEEEPTSSTDTEVNTIKMAINLSNQHNNNNIIYTEADYIGLTTDQVDDTYIIEYGDYKLKVKYVNPIGRFKQVALVKL